MDVIPPISIYFPNYVPTRTTIRIFLQIVFREDLLPTSVNKVASERQVADQQPGIVLPTRQEKGGRS